jgi:hypothetical protein
MRMRPLLWAVTCGVLLTACATKPYRVPESLVHYATIEYHLPEPFTSHFLHIISIDRKRIDRKSRGLPKAGSADIDNEKKVIALAEGTHLLHVHACERSGVWRCSNAVLRIEAVSGGQYRIEVTINRKGDYAEFWIESVESGDKVTKPIRVNGLDTQFFW